MTIKITNLPAIQTIDSDDVLPIVDVSEDVTKNISIQQIAEQVVDTIPAVTINGLSVSPGGSVTIPVGNNGTVTSISTNNGITGGTITDTGTIGLTGSALSLHQLNTNGVITKNGTTLSTVSDTITINGSPVSLGGSVTIPAGNNGTVTSVSTNNGITGGTITDTGTIGLTGSALSLHQLNTNGVITKNGTTLSTVSDTITINGSPVSLGGSVTIPVGNDGNFVTLDTVQTITATKVISVNDSSAALRITQTGAGAALLVEDSASTDSTPFVIDGAGNVGIGRTSPGNKLDVKGSGEIVRLESTDATGNNYLRFRGSSANLGYIGYGSAANNHLNISNEAASGDITIITNNLERVRINSSGNVGIGINNPQSKLVSAVSNASTPTTTIALYNSDPTNNNGNVLSFRSDTSGAGAGTYVELAAIRGRYTEHNHIVRSAELGFFVSRGAGPVEAMRIENDGSFATNYARRNTATLELPSLITTLTSNHNFVFARVAGSHPVILPQITTDNVGREYVFRKYSAASMSVTPNSADSFDYGNLGVPFVLNSTTTSYFFKIRSIIISDGTNSAGVWVLVYFNEYSGDVVASGLAPGLIAVP